MPLATGPGRGEVYGYLPAVFSPEQLAGGRGKGGGRKSCGLILGQGDSGGEGSQGGVFFA
jgi:hypothetical protein